MKIKPLFDRVILKPLVEKTKTQSGLILPDSGTDRPMLATVLYVGDGNQTNGDEGKMQVKVGDKVIYSRFGGISIKLDNEDLIIIRQTDILGILGE